MLKLVLITFLLIVISGCASENLRLDRLAHPGMNFENQLTDSPVSNLSNLDSIGKSNGGKTCVTCAK